MKWYEANMANDHQGLVVDELTGKNVAVSYEKRHAQLIAAAPDLLEACLRIKEQLLEQGFVNAYEGNRLNQAISKAIE